MRAGEARTNFRTSLERALKRERCVTGGQAAMEAMCLSLRQRQQQQQELQSRAGQEEGRSCPESPSTTPSGWPVWGRIREGSDAFKRKSAPDKLFSDW